MRGILVFPDLTLFQSGISGTHGIPWVRERKVTGSIKELGFSSSQTEQLTILPHLPEQVKYSYYEELVKL